MSQRETRTGGRDATDAVVPGEYALSIGLPPRVPPARFTWRKLTDLARLESGHTPSRSRPDYWDGGVPWIGIRDATGNHGAKITDTMQHVSQLGIDNSSARVLPARTVCLSRTASVGYVVMMGVPMATSQDFVNWVCGPDLSPEYLRYILMVEQESIRRFAYGSVHQTLYYPDAKALYVCVPSRAEQDSVTSVLGALDDKIIVNRATVDAALRLSELLVGDVVPRVPLGVRVAVAREVRNPGKFGSQSVWHYSLPRYDDGQTPLEEAAADIRSAKLLLPGPSVLVSKLNPRLPRVWDVPTLRKGVSVASTEFLVLTSGEVSTSVLRAVLSQPGFRSDLEGKVSGTSGSHQRVKPEDLLATEIVDPLAIPEHVHTQITAMGLLADRLRSESASLAALRDTLLPQLMSGRLRVKDAEKQVEAVV